MRPAWVKRQIDAMVAQFCSNKGNEAWIGVQSLAGLRNMHEDGLIRRGGCLEPMAGLPLSEGFVWRPEAPGGVPELWLAPTKTGYRAVFERFARRELGASGLDGANVQIDHVFPKKAGALGGMAYVRMLAVPPESNMAAGRTLEKVMVARNEAFGARGKVNRKATYFAIGKATGFAAYDFLPNGDRGAAAALAGALMAHLRAWGLPADVLADFDATLTADTFNWIR